MYAAIDVAAAKVLRQLRKYKTRVVERNVRTDSKTIRNPGDSPDFDALMDELADDKVVRVKEMSFEPLTEE
jgi:putative sigma-54 modulation protein